jgi:hypothetical protein
MAFLNHTARACHSDRAHPKAVSASQPDDMLPTRSSEQETRQPSVREQARAALAIMAIEGIFRADNAFTPPATGGPIGLLPLGPMQRKGLKAALVFLRHYVDSHARDG